ncbi:hypothetical protein [Acidiphilium sp.]|uniref:hypothetical protein n=1 Tax=Acidiphilium sp. TaxID=527 RepID=UPI003D067E32
MSSTYNVVALNPMPTALLAPHDAPARETLIVRTTAAFRAMLDAPHSPSELTLLRLIQADVLNGAMVGSITWSLDEVCNTIVIRQWPSCRVLDLVPFPVGKLDPGCRALRFAARITRETATLGIADDPDPAMKDETGRTIGSRVGVFP